MYLVEIGEKNKKVHCPSLVRFLIVLSKFLPISRFEARSGLYFVKCIVHVLGRLHYRFVHYVCLSATVRHLVLNTAALRYFVWWRWQQ
jgi:hypothetical protein